MRPDGAAHESMADSESSSVIRPFELFRLSFLLIFLVVSLSTPSRLTGQQPQTTSRTFSVPIAVTDYYGRSAIGLTKDQISIFEKDAQLKIVSLDLFDGPASVVFLFDLSGSITERFKLAAAQSAYRFAHNAKPENDYLVMKFDKNTMVMGDWGLDQQGLTKALGEIAKSTPKKNTSLYDACSTALKKLETSKYPIRVLLLFTDGRDNESNLSFNRLREEIKMSSVVVYPIGLLDPTGGSIGMEGQIFLDEMASRSGGRAFYPRTANELFDIIDQVTRDLSYRYIVRFNPLPSASNNKWHSIKFKLKLPPRDEKGQRFPNFEVRSHGGYYDY
jgi:Ca-activated chloride channel homolog